MFNGPEIMTCLFFFNKKPKQWAELKIFRILAFEDGFLIENFIFYQVWIPRMTPTHTTLFQHPSDVYNVQMTLNRRQNNTYPHNVVSTSF